MSNILLKTAVRTWFTLSSRNQATKRIRSALGDYLTLAERVNSETGAQAVTVPRRPGIDEDMRDQQFPLSLFRAVF
jgi:hypothetical protein